MPRKPRFFIPGVPVHIVHRGHSRDPVFFEDEDYSTYAYWLGEASKRYGIQIHSFVLMTNHVHLLITPPETISTSLFMQYIGRRYAPYMNQKYGKNGSIWEGRYKASLVQVEDYFLATMRYIELNPVRAGMVESPSHYRWSSFCHNSGLRAISFVRYHSVYISLAGSDEARFETYKELFRSQLDQEVMKQIADAWLTGTPLGNDYFREKVEAQLLQKVGHYKRGRPVKSV